ncbi:helix-turn-helix transcriptional regulator [Subdoligranulum variabile]|uniref:helix-turn-helix transcriptional regulator n=1 Tax=Subdoligranulum variabile TaxID=214851 RepID=UPI0026EA8841|nr:helix-turn-helix transcriptional regulator [Subdoligranulum variabile]
MPFKIKEARRERGYTQEELARRANVSRATIAGLESGATVVTTTETLIKIADALGKKVSDIFLA